MGSVFLQLLTAEVEQNEAKYLSIYLKSIHKRPAVMIPSQPWALNPFSHMTGTIDLVCPSA